MRVMVSPSSTTCCSAVACAGVAYIAPASDPTIATGAVASIVRCARAPSVELRRVPRITDPLAISRHTVSDMYIRVNWC
ncbi:hypothetical protein GCM10027064_11510 [Microbacterium petrolearium]